MFKKILIAAVLSGLTLLEGSAQTKKAKTNDHYPTLIHAEMPLYPAIPRTANISGIVEVRITVERGSVTEAEVVSSSSPFLANPTLANIKTWQFASEGRVTFLVKYEYEIKGRQTRMPENPRLELDLPRFVRIIARPFKPTRT